MIKSPFNTQTISDVPLHKKYYASHTAFLFNSSLWIILTMSGLLFTQVNPLRAMEPEEITRNTQKIKTAQGQSKLAKSGFYKDSLHPLTQPFWEKRDLSERLKNILQIIKDIKREIKETNKSPFDIIENNIKKYSIDLSCSSCKQKKAYPFPGIPHIDVLPKNATKPKRTDGRSGNEVRVVFHNDKALMAIKTFSTEDKELKEKKRIEGLKELLYSLLALDLNPCPEKLKMVRLYDAVLCPDGHLSIILEAANGRDIHHFLSTYLSKDIVKACAKYLAMFHIENHKKLDKKEINRIRYLKHVEDLRNTLLGNFPKNDKITNPLSLVVRPPLSKDELINVTSHDAIRLVGQDMQKNFEKFANETDECFKKNVEEIYRLLREKGNIPYFLTIVHGDAHGENFFYDPTQLSQKGKNVGKKVPKDSLYRITMIDLPRIIKSYGNIGDPAEDVGRFLGSLWDWAAQKGKQNNQEMLELQNKFLKKYLKKIKKGNIIKDQDKFEELFQENCNFYKLRFYRAVFNVVKSKKIEEDKKIKEKILMSWIWENSLSNPVSKSSSQYNISPKSYKDVSCKPVEEYIINNIPNKKIEGFIESTSAETKESYVKQLWKFFHSGKTQTTNEPSKTAILTGMPGVGKTSLAYKYALDNLKRKTYPLIYCLPSESENSLLNGYRKLLKDMGGNGVDTLTDEEVVKETHKRLLDKGKCFLVFDNVPSCIAFSTFLKKQVPQNADILITSRNNEQWASLFSNPEIIKLDVFHPSDSIKYLFTITGLEKNPANDKIVASLAKALGDLPLALSHAAHYISLVGGADVTKDTFNKYSEALQKNLSTRNPLNEREEIITYKNLVSKTLDMSKTLISNSAKENVAVVSKKILDYASYLNPDFIAEEVFIELKQNNSLEKAMNQLSSLSLIQRIPDKRGLAIHRLVQQVTRKEIEKNSNNKDLVLLHMVSLFDSMFKNNAQKIEKLSKHFPHMIQLLEHAKRLKINTPEVNSLEWIAKILFIIKEGGIKSKNNISPQEKSISGPQKGNIDNQRQRLLEKAKTIFNDSIENAVVEKWVLQVAVDGSPKIKDALGKMYKDGLFVKKDDQEARKWYDKAKQGNTIVANNPGQKNFKEGQTK